MNRSVGRSVGQSVGPNFTFHLPCSYRSSCLVFASSLSLHEYLHPATLWVDLLHHLNNTMSLLEMKLPYDPVCPSVMSSVGRSVGWSVSEVDKSFTLLLLSEHLCDLQLKIYDSNPRLPQVSRADP